MVAGLLTQTYYYEVGQRLRLLPYANYKRCYKQILKFQKISLQNIDEITILYYYKHLVERSKNYNINQSPICTLEIKTIALHDFMVMAFITRPILWLNDKELMLKLNAGG